MKADDLLCVYKPKLYANLSKKLGLKHSSLNVRVR